MAGSQPMQRRGLMFILSSPSGAGKTTISRMLLDAESNLTMSVSATTRPQRPGEIEGQDYYFVSAQEFERLVAADAFLEYAEVFGHRYGTPSAQIADGLARGQDYIFDIDWQGAQQLHQRGGHDVVKVFLLPPSIAELEHRLRSRGTDSEEVIAGRMDRARSEIGHYGEYDYVVINDEMESCFAKVSAILAAERLKRERQTGLVDFVRGLVS